MTEPMQKLGTLSVRKYMATKLVTFTPEMEVTQAIGVLVNNQYTGAPVVDESGALIGMLSEKDCLKVAVMANVQGVLPGLVGDYMTTKVDTIGPDANLLEVAKLFANAIYRRLPVIDRGKLVGQISRIDVLRAIQDLSR
jgi:predicted transcriptional regulator